jgi:hypothetical protein
MQYRIGELYKAGMTVTQDMAKAAVSRMTVFLTLENLYSRRRSRS